MRIHTRYFAIPEKWNELTGRQLVRVMGVLYSQMETGAAMLALLRIITGMSWYRFFRTPLADKYEALDAVAFLLKKSDLTAQLLPFYRGLYGPDSDFNNITGEEFIFSETFYFQSFTADLDGGPRQMNAEGLNKLAACLYRPKKKGYKLKLNRDGDARVPFNQYECQYRAMHQVSAWPAGVKLAIFTWYEACRNEMISANPDVFSGGSNEPAKYGLLSVMRVIAEGGIHGTFEQVQRMYVKMWMIELNEKAEEIKRQEKSVQK